MTTEEEILSLQLSVSRLQTAITEVDNAIIKLSQQVQKNSSLNGNSSTSGDSLNLTGDLTADNATFTGNEQVSGQVTSGSMKTGSATADDLTVKNAVTADTVTGKTVNATTGNATDLNVSDTIVTKNLNVTGAAHFVELIIDKVRSAGGTIILSAASMKTFGVTEETDDWKLTFLKKDSDGLTSDNDFIVGDQVICQSFSGKSGSNVSNKYYYSTVTESGDDDNYHYIKISKTYIGSGSVLNPEAGDTVVQLGFNERYMTDKSLSLPSDVARRETAIIESSYTTLDAGIYPPSIVQYHNLKNFCSLASGRLNYMSAGSDGSGDNSYSGKMEVKDDNQYIDLLEYINGKIPSQGTMYTAYAVDSNDPSAGWYITGYGTPDATKTYRYIGYVLTTKAETSLAFTDFTGWSRIDSTEYYKFDIISSSCLVSTEGKLSMSASYSVLHVNGSQSGFITMTGTSAFKVYMNGQTLLTEGADYTASLSQNGQVITFTIQDGKYNDDMSYFLIKEPDYNVSDRIDIKYSTGYIQKTTDEEFLSYYQGSKTVSVTYTDGYGVTQTYNVNLSTFFKQTSDTLNEHAESISKDEKDIADVKVTAGEVKQSVSSWKVTGQNRLYNTGYIKTKSTQYDYWKITGSSVLSLSSADNVEWMSIGGNAAGDGIQQSTNDRYGNYSTQDMTGGDTYTFSGLFKGQGTVNVVIQYLDSAGTVLGSYTRTINVTSSPLRQTFTFEATTGDNAKDLNIEGFNFVVAYAAGTSAYLVSVAQMQLEAGTVDTEWTENDKYLTIITQSLIDQKADDISLSLGNTGIDIKNGKITLSAANVTFSNDVNVNGNITAHTFATANNTFTVDDKGNITCTSGTFSNVNITGTINATSGKIGGFNISGSDLTNLNSDGTFNSDAAIIFRNDTYGTFAGIGGNVEPAYTGVRAVARFENEDTTDQFGLGMNIAMILNASGGNANFAFAGTGNGVLNGMIDGYSLDEFIPSDSNNVISLKNSNRIVIKGSYGTTYLPSLTELKQYMGCGSTEMIAVRLQVVLYSGASCTVFGYRDGNHGDSDSPHLFDQNASELTGGLEMQEGDSAEFLLCHENSQAAATGTPDTYRAYIISRHN